MKTCSMCHESKKISDFYKDSSKKDGVRSSCRKCDFCKRSALPCSRTSPSYQFNVYKQNARRREIEFSLSLSDFISMWKSPCSYCGGEIKTIGIDRIKNDRGYIPGNVTPCCSICNRSKGSMSYIEFVEHCKKVVVHSRRSSMVERPLWEREDPSSSLGASTRFLGAN